MILKKYKTHEENIVDGRLRGGDVTVGRRRSLFLDAFFGGFYIDGACQVVFNYDRNVTGSEITLLNAYGSAKTEGRLYAALVWKAGELVREFMPCVREEDETVGLYDLVNNEFYASTGMNALGANDVDFGMPHFYGTEKSDGFRAPVNYPVTGNFSFSMWVRNPDAGNFSSDYYNPTVFPHVGAVLGQGSVGGEPGFSCYMSNDGAGTTVMKVQVRPASGSVLTMVLPDDKLQAIQDDEWHHVVFTYDYTGGSAKFYIDGKVAFSQTEGLVEPGNSTSQHFAIGNRGSAMNIPYCGDVAYVSLWNRALTRNDVLMLRQAPARETDDGLLDAWTLDGGDSGLTGIVSGNKLSQSGNYGYQKSQINWRKVGFMLLLK